MRYRQFKESDKMHYAFRKYRKPEKRLQALIETVRDGKANRNRLKRELNACRYGNLRRNIAHIRMCLRMYAYYSEALHWLRKELSAMWLSRDVVTSGYIINGGAEDSKSAPPSEQ